MSHAAKGKKGYSLWTISKTEWGSLKLNPKNTSKEDVKSAMDKSAKDKGDTFKPVADSDLPAAKLD